MKQKTYESLMEKLDGEISRLEVPTTQGSFDMIDNNTDVSKMNNNQVILLHSMLHMFSSNKSGKGLQSKSIESLHSEVVKRLKIHTQFDGLDKND